MTDVEHGRGHYGWLGIALYSTSRLVLFLLRKLGGRSGAGSLDEMRESIDGLAQRIDELGVVIVALADRIDALQRPGGR